MPVVSIVCLTYNHEPFIRQALEGILKQKTDFTFEIVVHDDASTDRTQEIIREFGAKYPDIIKPIYQFENQKSKGNGIVTKIAFNAARGRYIAVCEGDDYWIDPYKLQKQVDILNTKPDINLVCTDYDYKNESTGEFIESQHKKQWYNKSFKFENNLKDSIATTLTVLFRASRLKPVLEELKINTNINPIDTVVYNQIIGSGKGFMLGEKTAIRRVIPTGMFSTHSKLVKSEFAYKALDSLLYLNANNKELYSVILAQYYTTTILIKNHLVEEGKKSKATSFLLSNLFNKRFKSNYQYSMKVAYHLARTLFA